MWQAKTETRNLSLRESESDLLKLVKWTAIPLAGVLSVIQDLWSFMILTQCHLVDFWIQVCLLVALEVNTCFMASPSQIVCLGEAPRLWTGALLRLCIWGMKFVGITSKEWNLENFNQVHSFSFSELCSHLHSFYFYKKVPPGYFVEPLIHQIISKHMTLNDQVVPGLAENHPHRCL